MFSFRTAIPATQPVQTQSPDMSRMGQTNEAFAALGRGTAALSASQQDSWSQQMGRLLVDHQLAEAAWGRYLAQPTQ